MTEPSPHASAWSRNKRWRTKHVDQHRAAHAAYMRTWRERKTAQAPARRRLDIRDWPKGNGCKFELTWPDGFKIEAEVKPGAAVLTAADWIEEIALTPNGEFVCNRCEQPSATLFEGAEQFVCEKCHAAA